MTQPDDILADIVPVILAGGMGRRLRPLTSGLHRPKPFLRLFSKHTWLQQTALRVKSMHPPAIVSHVSLRERIAADMKAAHIGVLQLFLEPEGRNTGPAVSVAAHYFTAGGNDPLMLVLPSDHVIRNIDSFLSAVGQGVHFANAGKIVLLGITPSRAESGYGYIKCGGVLRSNVCAVDSFAEKPDIKTARRFVREGGYLWNSGIFLFRASVFLASLERHNRQMYDSSLAALSRATRLQNAVFLDRESFLTCPRESIDRAVMEKSNNLCVIPADMGWRDLGCWRDVVQHVLHRVRFSG